MALIKLFYFLSAFDLCLNLLLKFKITFDKSLYFLSAWLIVILSLKIPPPKDVIFRNFLKLYMYLLDLYIKLYLLIYSSIFSNFIYFIFISLFSESFKKIHSIDRSFCSAGFKTFNASTCFFLGLELFSFVFLKLFLQENK